MIFVNMAVCQTDIKQALGSSMPKPHITDSPAYSRRAPRGLAMVDRRERALDDSQVKHAERVVAGSDQVPASPNIEGPFLYTTLELAIQIRHLRANQV